MKDERTFDEMLADVPETENEGVRVLEVLAGMQRTPPPATEEQEPKP